MRWVITECSFPGLRLKKSGRTTSRNYSCSQAAQIATTIIEGELDRMKNVVRELMACSSPGLILGESGKIKNTLYNFSNSQAAQIAITIIEGELDSLTQI